MSFKSIFQDVRNAVDFVHIKVQHAADSPTHTRSCDFSLSKHLVVFPQGSLKSKTIEDLNKYIHRDDRLKLLLDRIREHGGKSFLLTNSDYEYTNVRKRTQMNSNILEITYSYTCTCVCCFLQKVMQFLLEAEQDSVSDLCICPKAKHSRLCVSTIMIMHESRLQTRGTNREWTDYFDYVVVDAKKPGFFSEGTILRQIDRVRRRHQTLFWYCG